MFSVINHCNTVYNIRYVYVFVVFALILYTLHTIFSMLICFVACYLNIKKMLDIYGGLRVLHNIEQHIFKLRLAIGAYFDRFMYV